MSLTVPPFRPGDSLPSAEEVAELLASAVPESDRKTARGLLVDRILPAKLAGLATHPRPQRLTSVVYKELARALAARPANMRLHALQVAALEADLLSLGRDALHLAITRYLAVHPEAADAERVGPWVKPEVDEMRECAADTLSARIQAVQEQLDAWSQQAKTEYPVEWEKHREKYVQVVQALIAARSGRFDDVTGGSLQEFLRDALGPERRP